MLTLLPALMQMIGQHADKTVFGVRLTVSKEAGINTDATFVVRVHVTHPASLEGGPLLYVMHRVHCEGNQSDVLGESGLLIGQLQATSQEVWLQVFRTAPINGSPERCLASLDATGLVT